MTLVPRVQRRVEWVPLDPHQVSGALLDVLGQSESYVAVAVSLRPGREGNIVVNLSIGWSWAVACPWLVQCRLYLTKLFESLVLAQLILRP